MDALIAAGGLTLGWTIYAAFAPSAPSLAPRWLTFLLLWAGMWLLAFFAFEFVRQVVRLIAERRRAPSVAPEVQS